MVKGSRLAGFPISRNRSGHFLFIQRSSFRGSFRGGFVTAVTNVFFFFVSGGCGSALFESDDGLVVLPSKAGTSRRWIRYREVESSMNSANSSGEAILMLGVGLAGQSMCRRPFLLNSKLHSRQSTRGLCFSNQGNPRIKSIPVPRGIV